MATKLRLYKIAGWGILILLLWLFSSVANNQALATLNITEYSDTLTDSGPSEPSNHTIRFNLETDVGPGGVIEVTPPPGFTIINDSRFSERNVELVVDGTVRISEDTASAGIDQVEINPGSPGLIRYTLAPDFSINAGTKLELRIGNQTSLAVPVLTTFSTSTGTTTTPGDVEPIINSADLGRHDVTVEVYDGSLVAEANPIIFLVEKVRMPNIDTTEEIPPFRFNPAPTSSVGGTTLNVEISLETNEFAICRYDLESGTDFNVMPLTFTNTGLIFHTAVVAVTPESTQTFYVRCIDDEGNFNIDDFLIEFTVNEIPTGSSTVEGAVDGDGSGTGSEGTGDGAGGGGTTGESDGEAPLTGGSAGTGGSGGGGGGGTGGSSGSSGGGGFESTDGPYRSGDARVIISGYAYPNSEVGFLVDGNLVEETRANAQGSYSVTLDEIARGAYTFGVYAIDPDDNRSSTFSTSFTVSGARTSALSNINVPPSINVEPDPVDPGQTLTVSGYGLPDSTITIETGPVSGSATELTATADGSGEWSTTIDTNGFSRGTYQIRARSEQADGRTTNFSNYEFYGVGEEAEQPSNTDLNRDGSVNLVDFSILLFWWNSDGGDSDPSADINGDGNVSLVDFSILLFNWTG
jgi:hypothetical protein